MRAALRFVRQTPCLTLLVVQLLGVVLYPFLPGSSLGRTVFSAFGNENVSEVHVGTNALALTSDLVFDQWVLNVVINSAFDATERQVKELVEKRRRDVKTHAEPVAGTSGVDPAPISNPSENIEAGRRMERTLASSVVT